jgi:aminopeptidase N
MRNFYTTTVYEKGAEVVRLYQTLLGEEGFKKGLTHYLNKFDGTAATCDDFLASMAEANHENLSGFEHWYSQAGTPRVQVAKEIIDNGIKLTFKQLLCSEGSNLQPQWIPIRFALIGSEDKIIYEDTFILKSWEESITLPCKETNVALSLFRDFSAPVIVDYPYTEEELMKIAFFETDYFARWEAAQRYISELIASEQTWEEKQAKFIAPFNNLLQECRQEPSFYALFFTLPDPISIQSTTAEKDLAKIWEQRGNLIQYAAKTYEAQWLEIYQSQMIGNASARDLKNSILNYLATLPNHEVTVAKQYEAATNMTDRMAALRASVLNNHSTAKTLLTNFLEKYKAYPSVVDKWFALQVSSPYITLEVLNHLRHHGEFNSLNPNRVRSLLGALGQNKVALYQQPQLFYPWLLDNIMMIDKINPQVAARLATPFSQLDFLKQSDQDAIRNLVKAQLANQLSTNLAEQLSKSL